MLCQTLYLSLDPYMRGRMNAGRSYVKGVAVGEVMTAGTVSRVAESRLDGFAVGDFVLTGNGWQDYALTDGRGVRKLDPDKGADLNGGRSARHARTHGLCRLAGHREAQGE